jgi:hypothetical protein
MKTEEGALFLFTSGDNHFLPLFNDRFGGGFIPFPVNDGLRMRGELITGVELGKCWRGILWERHL